MVEKETDLLTVHQEQKQESIMKIYALVVMAIVALAGCSTSYKGSIQGANNPEPSKSSNSVASQGVGQSAVLVQK
jgi:outer membrane protein assembly factor BamE (lipoprotein component of BamABCDE complex)